MAFNVNNFTGALKLGGARASLFQVNITNPVNGSADIQVPFMVKGSQIPAATLGKIELPYFGRKVNIAGDRTYEDWTTTILNDEDFAVRNAIEEWHHSMNKPVANTVDLASASPSAYKTDAQITQYSKTGVPIRVYNFVGLWPQNVASIEMNWETTDAIEEFEVTWAYDYWQVSGGVTGDGGTT